MDDTVRFLSILLLGFALIGGSANTSELEYISPEKQKSLETMFENSDFSPKKDTKTLQEHAWVCDMFGVRSKLQVQRDLKLYKWSVDEKDLWHNDGAQLVSNYSAKKSELVGNTPKVQDEVKITKDGQLISRLSTNPPLSVVIAYSVCK